MAEGREAGTVLRIAMAAVFIIVGIAGVVLPFISGILLIGLGALLIIRTAKRSRRKDSSDHEASKLDPTVLNGMPRRRRQETQVRLYAIEHSEAQTLENKL